MAKDEFFKNEVPDAPPEKEPSGNWGNDGHGGSIGGGGFGGGGGGGGGGGSDNGDWGNDGPGDDPEDEKEPDPEIYAPFLKSFAFNVLAVDKTGHLLEGNHDCKPYPSIVLWARGKFKHEDDTVTARDHARCILTRIVEDEDSSGHAVAWSKPIGHPVHEEDEESTPIVVGNVKCWIPGKYKIQFKWQAGHWKYEEIRELRLNLWGVEANWTAYPKTVDSWKTAFEVEITDVYEVFVNGQRADIDANGN